jgi:subtilisin-like proprotein convertase family protein
MKNLFTNGFKKAKSISMFLFAFAFAVNMYAQTQPVACVNDTNDPTFQNCSNKTVTLLQGECTAKLTPFLSATDNCIGKIDTFNYHTSMAITQGHGCLSGDASYFQVFTPSTAVRYTPFTINRIRLGVSNAVNSPFVNVKIYKTDGSITSTSGWTQIGGGSTFLPLTSNAVVTIPITSLAILPSETFAVEVITPTSSVFGTVAGIATGQTGPTYVRSTACGINTLTDVASVLGVGKGLVLGVIGTFNDVMITPANATTPSPYADFTAGVYNLSYFATDASGNSSSCQFTYTVNKTPNVVTSLTCNDLVNISLDTACMATVTPDEILEGGPYGCDDNYDVVIYNKQNQPIGDKLTSAHVGQTLKVTVFDSANNSCWGQIKVEDKSPAVLDCQPVYTTCVGDLKPGSNLSSRLTYQATNAKGAVITKTNKYSNDFIVSAFGTGNATVSDVDVMIDIEHTDISDLQLSITSPQGVTRRLFANVGATCTSDNIRVKLDDEAANAMSSATCNAISPAISGSYKPMNTLNAFDGLKVSGDWIISVIDSSATDGGTIKELSVVFTQTGGKVSFPTSKPVTFTELSAGYYSVTGIDPCGPVSMGYNDKVVESACSSIYTKIIDRTWSATDASGNISTTCTQKIYVYRNGLTTLQFPPNYDGIENPTLSCVLYGSTVPTPAVTGKPTGDFCDNVQIFPYEDLKIDICDKSYKILRKWRLLEWCSGDVIEHTQLIKVLDDEGPVLTCPKDVTLSTDDLFCTRDYTPARPTVDAKECSDKLTYELSYFTLPAGVTVLPADALFTSSGIVLGEIPALPIGVSYVRWRVEDECKNTGECIFKVTVRDEVPPVAVCDQFTKVSIGSYQYSKVAAITFDDGSNDNCEIVKWDARKMTNKCPQVTNNSVFTDSLIFCCEEVNSTIMVEFRVTDNSNNRNTCMVEIKVEDKLPPYITKCPADITLDCQADYKNTDVTKLPMFIDNCGVVSVSFNDSGSPDQCGEGIIRRTHTVKDAQNLAASCVQIITLLDSDPFYYNIANPNDPKNDIKFSPDYDATTCNADLAPENLPAGFGYPQITDDDCSLTSVTFKDQLFTFVDGACEKILRTWTVIDWCTYVQGTNIGIYTDLQIIKLSNTSDPTFIECKDVTVDVFGDCKGEVKLSIEGKDDCTKEADLRYSYKIDLYKDNVSEGSENLLKGATKSFTHELPIGVHRVTWTVEDKCGNITFCNQLVTVRDGKKPTPYCLSSVTTVVMPSNKMISIWAKDFDLGSFDNCTPKNKLKISFSANVLDTGRVYTCADIPDGIETEIPVEMWVTDEAGNKDYCTVYIIIQDNSGDVCIDNVGSKVVLGGRIKTINDKSLNDAMVSLYEGTKLVKQIMTASAGNFTLNNIPTDKNYELQVEKDNDLMNGLSTLDLVLIQRHILGLAKHDSPYKIIASDANNDGKVTAADLVVLRKLILGMTTKFTNNQKSWRFLNVAKPFDVATNPFPFTERISLSDLNSNKYNQDFYAVKIGDVNGSLTLNANNTSVEPRSNETLKLGYEVSKLGMKTTIKVYAEDEATIYGFQSMFNLKNATIKGAKINVNDDNYLSNERSTTISWNNDKGILVAKDDLLFTIETSGDVKMELEDKFSNEAYLSADEVSQIDLTNRNKAAEEMAFEVFQNEPNPFSNQTNIGFKIPEAGNVSLKIYDQSGKILYKDSKDFGRGVNYFIVSQNEIQATGIMYYEINSNQFKATRKMIGLK